MFIEKITTSEKCSRRIIFPVLSAAVITALIMLALPSAVFSQSVIAIKGGTILTMTGETIENGTVLIRNGKIAAVGSRVSIPGSADVIDASGKYVMPGIIDAMTYYGIRPFGLNDVTKPITPENKIIQAFYPYGEFMRGEGGVEIDREILSGGVTTVYIAPGDRQLVGGQGAVVKTYGKNVVGMTMREPAAIDMTIGDTAKNPGNASPKTRMALASMLRKALMNAQEFDRTVSKYKNKSDEERKKASKPKRDLANEALVQLLHKKIPARIEADLIGDIRMAMRITEEFDIDLIIDSGLGAYKVADVLAEKNIPVVLGPSTHPFIIGGEVSMTAELYKEFNEYNAAKLLKAGVKFAIASYGFSFGSFGGATAGRWLLIEAAYATGFGIPDEEALKAITINAAEILGVDDRIGSIEPGKDADVIILDGPPLLVKTWVEKVLIDGKLIYTKK